MHTATHTVLAKLMATVAVPMWALLLIQIATFLIVLRRALRDDTVRELVEVYLGARVALRPRYERRRAWRESWRSRSWQ